LSAFFFSQLELAWSSQNMNSDVVQQIIDIFQQRGGELYGSEAVTQMQHAIQTAVLAQQENAEPSLVTAALLHDVGHLLGGTPLPCAVADRRIAKL
jgi:[1-hydroxy-2-(trimethylamino)ethyl]phosphonate dioxygenase